MFCRKCGAKIPNDSVYCSHCGIKVITSNDFKSFEFTNRIDINSSNNSNVTLKQKLEDYKADTYLSPKSFKKERKHFRKNYWIYILPLIIVIIITTTAIVATNNTSDSPWVSNSSEVYEETAAPTPTPVIAPANGEILFGHEGTDSQITINTSSQSCVVKLKDSYGSDVISFYIKAHSTVTVGLPGQFMYVYFASGETWYGESKLFGEETSYSMDDKGVDFSQYTMEYTLYPVTNGNFHETPIDASEF